MTKAWNRLLGSGKGERRLNSLFHGAARLPLWKLYVVYLVQYRIGGRNGSWLVPIVPQPSDSKGFDFRRLLYHQRFLPLQDKAPQASSKRFPHERSERYVLQGIRNRYRNGFVPTNESLKITHYPHETRGNTAFWSSCSFCTSCPWQVIVLLRRKCWNSGAGCQYSLAFLHLSSFWRIT